MLRGSHGIGHHCFGVRAHDRPDPRLARVTPELIRLASAAADPLAQSLHRYIETDLGPVAEAVDDCPRRIRDGDVDILDAMTLYLTTEGIRVSSSGKLHASGERNDRTCQIGACARSKEDAGTRDILHRARSLQRNVPFVLCTVFAKERSGHS